MEKIGKHISELLFDHDCVIVPSLGGFLASNEHARMVFPNNIIYPPYRRIAFNVYLKQNDGLLANHLVESENIPYADANSLIEEFTVACIENLEQGKKVNIEDVGTLFFDKEKNIQFEAYRNINHSKDSFGMEPVQVIPIQRTEVETEKRKPVEKAIRPSYPPKEKELKPVISRKGKRYIGVAAAVAAIIWFSANLYLVAPKKYEAISLNPFDSQEIFISKSDSLRNSPPPTIPDTQTNLTDSSLVAENVPVVPSGSEPKPAETHENIPPVVQPAETTETEPIRVITNKHYTIAGVFKIKENAISLLKHLRESGFKNARIIEANNRSYVSYQEFNSAGEALVLIDSLREENLEGWIWKH